MDSLYFLIPVSILLIIVVTVIFLWAVRSGQFDDLDGPAHSILHEEERLADTADEAVDQTGDKLSGADDESPQG